MPYLIKKNQLESHFIPSLLRGLEPKSILVLVTVLSIHFSYFGPSLIVEKIFLFLLL